MERIDRESILSNLNNLVVYTVVSDPLLAFMQEKNVFSVVDVDIIKSIHQETGQAMKFYEVIQTRRDAYSVLLEGLRKTNQYEIIELLMTNLLPSSMTTKRRTQQLLFGKAKESILFDVKLPDPLFSGRGKELAQLDETIKQSLNSGSSNPPVITVLVGLGGIGKTSLCRKYVEMHKRNFEDCVLWINGENESTLTQSFTRLARDCLQISVHNADNGKMDVSGLVNQVYKHFEKCNCLFVFDNVEKGSHLGKFLPLCISYPENSIRPVVLMTSRESEWEYNVQVIKLRELDEEDTISMIRNGLRNTPGQCDDDKEILKLARRLQCFPLALRQAISYIREQQGCGQISYTIQNYLEDFEAKQKEMLSFKDSPFCTQLTNDYELTTFSTWRMTTEKFVSAKKQRVLAFSKYTTTTEEELAGDLSMKILEYIGYMQADRIHCTTLWLLVNNNSKCNQKIFHQSLRFLLKYSMIEAENENKTIVSVHRLVQDVTRINLTFRKKEHVTLHTILTAFSNELNSDIVDHSMSTWKYSTTALRKEFANFPAKILRRLVDDMRYTESFRFGLSAFSDLETIYKDTSKLLFWSYGPLTKCIAELGYELCTSLYSAGKSSDAFNLYQTVLTRHLELHKGKDHSDIFNDYLGMGRCLSDMGKLDEAIVYMKKSTEGFSRINSDISWVYYSLAILYGRIGTTASIEECVKILKQCMKLDPSGNERGKLKFKMRTALMLGYYLKKQGNLAEATTVLTENLMREKLWSGENFAAYNGSSRYLADILREEGKYMEAMKAHSEVYKLRFQLFGDSDLKTLLAKQDIAIDLFWIGEHAESLKYFEEVHDSLVQKCGLEDSHWQVLECKEGMADILAEMDSDKKKMAFEMYKFVETKLADTFGNDHVKTKAVASKIAILESTLNV